jgi:hypothetical protein
VAALDAEDAARQKAQAAQDRAQADRLAKVDAALAARTLAIVEDFATLERAAVHAAAEALARAQLEAEHGITDPRTLSVGWPTRLGPDRVDQARKRLAGSLPLPWRKGGQSADAYRSAMTAEAAATLYPATVTVDDVETRVAAQRQKIEARRQLSIANRKAAARANGTLPPAA